MQMTFLFPVWGERYIKTFAETTLRSLLTRNNIPSLASFQKHFRFLTNTSGRRTFESLPDLERLRPFGSVEFVDITDLIGRGNYGVTLTLAFARGLIMDGDEQVGTAYIFMNADFVISDGSLTTVGELLNSGSRCVIAPSLRVNAEVFTPLLESNSAASEEDIFDSRRLVQQALANVHPTVQARTLSQDNVSCAQYGQFYWRINETTLIGAQHLIFHPCIRPERPLRKVTSYHDFCFVPDMIPSGRFDLIDDSDKFFMIELQARLQESEMVHAGPHIADWIRTDISGWSTAEHRAFARIPVVFHAGTRSSNIDAHVDTAREFVIALQRQFMHPPVQHAGHYFWTRGVAAWIETCHQMLGDRFVLPPELAEFTGLVTREQRLAKLAIVADESAELQQTRQYALLSAEGLSVPLYSSLALRDERVAKVYNAPPNSVSEETRRRWITDLDRCASRYLPAILAKPVGARDLSFATDLLGVGWGDYEVIGGQSFRWLAPRHDATIWLRVPPRGSFDLRTYIYTCSPALLPSLRIEINGKSLLPQSLGWEIDRYYLWVKVPEDIARTSDGVFAIRYRADPADDRRCIALSQLVVEI